MSAEVDQQVAIRGNFIIFHGKRAGLSIPLQNCRNPRMILQWSYHLINREWITKEMIKDFIDLSTHYHGINL